MNDKFQKEYELRDYIADNFSDYFKFSFVGKEFHIGKKKVDLAGEDDETFYLIEIKNKRVDRKAINQIERYVGLYKSLSIKAVQGILIAPKIAIKEETYINSKENLRFLRIEGPSIINGKDYLVRDIDDDIYVALRVKAVEKHTTVRQIMIRLLDLFASDKLNLEENARSEHADLSTES